MARDLPDWGAQSAQKTVYEVTDLGELAARLGSIVTHDRRGDVVWLDDFENGLDKWETVTGGTGAGVDLSITRSRNGLFCARLVGGSDGTRQAEIQRWLPFPVLTSFGVEESFALPGDIEKIRFGVGIYDGTNLTAYNIEYVASSLDLSYLDVDGVAVPFATDLSFVARDSLFHTIKVVVDGENGEYGHVILDNVGYPLTDIPAQVIADATLPTFHFHVRMFSHSGHNDVLLVDDAIVTQNEPI